jgi:hypothetical protein
MQTRPVNWNDPVERLRTLREAYYRLLSGQMEYEFEYIGNGVQRRIRYSQTDMAELKRAITLAEAEIHCVGPRINTIRLVTSKGV